MEHPANTHKFYASPSCITAFEQEGIPSLEGYLASLTHGIRAQAGTQKNLEKEVERLRHQVLQQDMAISSLRDLNYDLLTQKAQMEAETARLEQDVRATWSLLFGSLTQQTEATTTEHNFGVGGTLFQRDLLKCTNWFDLYSCLTRSR